MGETPVALDCFLRTNLWFIFEDMAGHGRDPFVLRARRGGEKREREGWEEKKERREGRNGERKGRGGGGRGGRGGRKRGREGRREKERGKKGRKGEKEGLDKHTSKGGQWLI